MLPAPVVTSRNRYQGTHVGSRGYSRRVRAPEQAWNPGRRMRS
jgi:hypothetical protein